MKVLGQYCSRTGKDEHFWVCGTHWGAVLVGVSTRNRLPLRGELRNRDGFNKEWLGNWKILRVPPP